MLVLAHPKPELDPLQDLPSVLRLRKNRMTPISVISVGVVNDLEMKLVNDQVME